MAVEVRIDGNHLTVRLRGWLRRLVLGVAGPDRDVAALTRAIG